jgi:hypothetical protein
MMLLKLLSDYLNQVEQAIVQCENAYVECYQEEILTSQRANLRIRLRFKQTHLLEINGSISFMQVSNYTCPSNWFLARLSKELDIKPDLGVTKVRCSQRVSRRNPFSVRYSTDLV